ncbi:MAG: alanine dehydrogenase [Candidatus Hydrogenedentes bacterium]|nr:alanine dehydrogenase [Candidatus Hydrogenedentota bacterium]
MIVGVPKEIKTDEQRVAIVPSGVAAFVAHGHTVLIEHGAGLGSGIPDEAYRDAGAELVRKAKSVWDRANLIMKVKEPLGPELKWLRPSHVLYTYLHLASNEELTRALLKARVACVAYETIQTADGALPLLVPMSEVAGRLSIQKGAFCLEAGVKGRGVLLSGTSGTRPAKVVIIGAGIAGTNACQVASGIGADVTVLDINLQHLRYVHDILGGRITTLMSNRANIEEEVTQADLVIGAVLIPGALAPRLITKDLVKRMRPGSAIVDIAVDQGGCCETSHPTTHSDPIYHVSNVVHYCVSNMPGAVPRTSTFALTNVTLGYGLAIADKGLEQAMANDRAIRKGLNLYRGCVTYKAVADAFGMEWTEVAT